MKFIEINSLSSLIGSILSLIRMQHMMRSLIFDNDFLISLELEAKLRMVLDGSLADVTHAKLNNHEVIDELIFLTLAKFMRNKSSYNLKVQCHDKPENLKRQPFFGHVSEIQ